MNLLGQPHIAHYLNQGLSLNLLPPSLLFVGPAGVGKKTAAKTLAKKLLCADLNKLQDGPLMTQHEQTCSTCRQIEEGHHQDMVVMNRTFQADYLNEDEKKQTAIKIDSVRFMDNFLHLKSLGGGPRIVIIEEAHQLTDDAANALLKLLEEPPPQSFLVLIAPDEHQLPGTVISRCAILRFRLIPVPDIVRWLHSKFALDLDLADMIALKSQGSLTEANRLKDDETPALDWTSFSRPEFFNELKSPQFRKDPRGNAGRAIDQLLETSHKHLLTGDLNQQVLIGSLLKAKRKIKHHVSPQLVLEELFLKIESLKTQA